MLWFCLSFPDLPASALGLHEAGEVVAAQSGSQRWLITSAPGIAAGTLLSHALSLNPRLRVHARKPQAERETLLQLAHWLYHYGSPVGCQMLELAEPGRCPRARLWFEAGASLKLFGGLEGLRQALFAELAELGQRAGWALAPTHSAAALLAESGCEQVCFDRASLGAALARLPIEALPWPGESLQALAGVGLRRLGELFELPRAAFARRFGERLLHDLDRLRGLAPEPFDAIVPPPRYARRFELSGELETVEPLLFPLKRMCTELAAYLRARDSGALSLQLICSHAYGAATALVLRFLAPTRDAARMFAALNERLLREPPDRPVRELALRVDEFATPQPLQLNLFDAAGGQKLEWEQALERVQARCGEEALWTPRSVADHRPECAQARSAPGAQAPVLAAPRPLWLLRSPRPIEAPPVDGPFERIESGWWDGADSARDYHCVEREGGRLWVFRDRRSGAWFVHGLFG